MAGFGRRSGSRSGDADPADVACPFCGSTDTTVTQRKGTAICRKMFVCDECEEPFEQFD